MKGDSREFRLLEVSLRKHGRVLVGALQGAGFLWRFDKSSRVGVQAVSLSFADLELSIPQVLSWATL